MNDIFSINNHLIMVEWFKCTNKPGSNVDIERQKAGVGLLITSWVGHGSCFDIYPGGLEGDFPVSSGWETCPDYFLLMCQTDSSDIFGMGIRRRPF